MFTLYSGQRHTKLVKSIQKSSIANAVALFIVTSRNILHCARLCDAHTSCICIKYVEDNDMCAGYDDYLVDNADTFCITTDKIE